MGYHMCSRITSLVPRITKLYQHISKIQYKQLESIKDSKTISGNDSRIRRDV
jgi:hypothetical protein